MDTKELAIELHDRFCDLSHVDQCSWNYEKDGDDHEWEKWAHKRWLKKAKKIDEFDLVKGIDSEEKFDELLNIIEIV